MNANLTAVLFLVAIVAPVARAADEAPPRSPLAGVPRALDPRPLGVGRLIPDAAAADVAGERRALAALLGPRATVVAMTSATCPVAQKLAPALARLERDLAPKGVAFVFVNTDRSDAVET